jgi:hypothetical protein
VSPDLSYYKNLDQVYIYIVNLGLCMHTITGSCITIYFRKKKHNKKQTKKKQVEAAAKCKSSRVIENIYSLSIFVITVHLISY